MMLKIGDRVSPGTAPQVFSRNDYGLLEGTVTERSGGLCVNVQWDEGGKYQYPEKVLDLIISDVNNMNLKEKFALVFKGEPEKSFIKAGVMNSDETLTSDGQQLLLSYLLKKNGDDFKTTVVDPILAESKE